MITITLMVHEIKPQGNWRFLCEASDCERNIYLYKRGTRIVAVYK